jgi:N-acetylglucosaminyl-diphospho-decaprenol L-rhamnosyltransferase
METTSMIQDSSLSDPQAEIPDLSIILVCWNNKEYLENCLNSLYNDQPKCTFDVIVTDNGSSDGSQAMLREKFPQVKIIQNERNLGLGKASNQGILATNGRYVLLLNNDTIVNGGSLGRMVEYIDKNPKVGAVGGKLLNPDGSVQFCYNKFPTLPEEFLIATRIGELFSPGYPTNITATKTKSICWSSSACLLLRRTALDQVGLIDEEYFIYGDEVDLQYRLKKAGWDIYFLPEVTTIHFGGRSMDRWRRRKMVYRGKMFFFKKNYGSFSTWVLRLMLGILSLIKMLIWAILSIFPDQKDKAKKELNSNIEVVKLCWNLR